MWNFISITTNLPYFQYFIIIIMSTEIGKTIQIYEQSLTLLQAKRQLFVGEGDINMQPNESPITHRMREGEFQNWSTFIIKSINTLLKNWSKSYFMFQDLQSHNKYCIKQIANKLADLKNNKHLLSKQQQLIQQIQNQIREWNQIQDPITFYDLKRRGALVQNLKKKVEETKNSLGITKKSTAPLYMRKIEQQLKTTIYNVYINSVNIDSIAKKKGIYCWESILQMAYNQNKGLKNIHYIRYINEYKNQFSQNFHDLMGRRVKLNQNLFLKYCQQLNILIKNIIRSWSIYNTNLKQLEQILRYYVKLLDLNKQDLTKRQKNVVDLLQQSNNYTVNTIFRIDTSLKIISTFNQIFQILNIIKIFINQIRSSIDQISEQLYKSNNYLKYVSTQITNREKQFYIFCTDDKNFLQAHTKAQLVIEKKLIESYQNFLNEVYKIAKYNYRQFTGEQQPIYQSHEIAGLLNRQITSTISSIQSSGHKNSRSHSTSSNEKNSFQLGKEKNQKLIEIEQFLKKMQIFDPSTINWNRNNVFSCALGPKLLLHGSIAILAEGLYYESFFNKKNLFFGKTKLFVPRNQILQINVQNTLVIFPDAVQIKTPVGSLYFHALGSRQIINNTLNQVYYPQNSPNQNQQASNSSFIGYKQEELQKFSQAQLNEILKQNEVLLSELVVKNIKIGKFFKRYFSSDSIQIRGQKYQNFKTYILLLIQAIEPKCTPLTPEPPSYFFYSNQQAPLKNFPKISQRIHTYRKKIPKIPFLSSGGEGLCEDKQTYYWISPSIFVIIQKSTVKGFSLTEGMQIISKQVIKQQNNSVKMTSSLSVKFLTQSGSNSLVKGPTITNLKDVFQKMGEQIQKYQKGKQGRTMKNKGGSLQKNYQNQQLEERLEKLQKQNGRLKKMLKMGLILFIFIYILSLFVLSRVYSSSA